MKRRAGSALEPHLSACVGIGSNDAPHVISSKPGTYALILHSQSNAHVEVGRWGHLDVEPGYYIYVGSALGPGGLRARVSRHFRKTKAKHWHIDYLREAVDAVCAWYSYRHKSREHQWARAIRETMQTSAVKGFGCSDCGCYSHLLMTAKEPSLVQFSDAVGGTIESRSYRVFEE